MRALPASPQLPKGARGAVFALGNFDGLHAGHRAVIERARVEARKLSAPLGVATFEPSPRRHFQPDAPPFRILTPVRRDEALTAMGVDVCALIAFDKEMAAMTDREFASEILVRQLGARAVCVGFDFRFGRDRIGDAASLQTLGAELGFGVHVIPEVASAGEKVSSSGIRERIAAGDMAGARDLLGDWWTFDGIVEHGEKRGRELGFPTANLHMGEIVHPADGVYALWARLDAESMWRPAVASFGRTPMTGLRDPLLEIVIFDWSGDLYGTRLHAAFAKRLRPQGMFPDLAAMVAQMHADAAEARAVLAGLAPPAY